MWPCSTSQRTESASVTWRSRACSSEQQAGRLRLSPHMLVTTAELRTPEMTQRLVEAFGVRPSTSTPAPRR
jgi:hypothetical protein